MSYQTSWRSAAGDAAAAFLKDDPEGLIQLLVAVNRLGDDPRPSGTVEYGSPDLRRMHIGRYRMIYEISDATAVIAILHLGRTS